VRAPASMADGRGYWMLPPPPPETRPHLNGVNPGVEVERPRGVADVAVIDGGGGVATGATTAAMAAAVAGFVVVVPPLWHRGCRKWSSSAIGGGGAADQAEVHHAGEEP
jgi:hypothetical protein